MAPIFVNMKVAFVRLAINPAEMANVFPFLPQYSVTFFTLHTSHGIGFGVFPGQKCPGVQFPPVMPSCGAGFSAFPVQ